MRHYPVKTLKPKRCKLKSCGEKFIPSRPLQSVCNPVCGVGYARQLREQKAAKEAQDNRKRLKAEKEKLKTRTDHLNELQAIFNRYIRIRDKNQPCISCDTPATANVKWDAGHFFSVGQYPNLRLNEDNNHKQCVPCNQHKHGNTHEYRIRLKARIGEERFAALEADRRKPLKLTEPEIIELKKAYRAKIKEMLNNSNAA